MEQPHSVQHIQTPPSNGTNKKDFQLWSDDMYLEINIYIPVLNRYSEQASRVSRGLRTPFPWNLLQPGSVCTLLEGNRRGFGVFKVMEGIHTDVTHIWLSTQTSLGKKVSLLLNNNGNNKVSPLKHWLFRQASSIVGHSCFYIAVGFLAVPNPVPRVSCYCMGLTSRICQSMGFQAGFPMKRALQWVQLWHLQAAFFRDSFHRDFWAAAQCFNYDTIRVHFYPY